MSKKGEIRVKTQNGGVKTLPVFDPSDVPYDVARVQTASGVGSLNFVNPSKADIPEVRIQTQNHGTLGIGTKVFQTTTTLNGENAELKVFEDTDNDGKPENKETFTLTGGLEYHVPTKIQMTAGNTLWFYIQFENSTVTDSAELSDVTLLGNQGEIQWTDQTTFAGEQSSAGNTTDRLNDHPADKVSHGYSHEQPILSHGLIGWWPLTYTSGNAPDLSIYNSSGALSGSPNRGVAGRAGLQAYSFDGSDDEVNIGSISRLKSTPLTVSIWFKAERSNTYENIVGAGGGGAPDSWWIDNDGNGNIRWSVYDGSSSYHVSYSISTNQWYHAVGTYDGSKLELFVNGSSVGTNSSPSGLDTGDNVRIANDEGGNRFKGNVTDYRHYNRILSSSEITTLYNTGSQKIANPPAGEDSGAISRYKFDGDTTDSWSNNDGTNNGVSFVSDSIEGKSGDFEAGNNEYIDISSVDIGGMKEVTFSAWINPESIPSSTPGHGGSSTGDATLASWRIGSDDAYTVNLGNNNEIYFYVDNGSNNSVTTNSSPLATNNWYKVTTVYDGNSGYGRIFVNGQLLENFTGSGSIIDGSISATIGSSAYNTPSDLYDGKMDDVRIYSRALKPREVRKLYLWGTRGIDMQKVTPVR